jgi:hypothetical protein
VAEQEILTFVAASIRSVWALELLLFLKRNSVKTWDRDNLILELRSSSAVIGEALASLEAAGLVVGDSDTNYQFHPASPMLDQVVSELERLYAAKPLSVINAIVSSPTMRLQMFSDAFKLKE